MGLFSNRVTKYELKAGDHIYSWRTAYVYAHHGIYVGDNKVIHFTRQGEEVQTGTFFDKFLTSSMPKRPEVPCPDCTQQEECDGIVLSCLDCFLAGYNLYRYEYTVGAALFLAKTRGGTCTCARSDPDEVVLYRAFYLLKKGFGSYNVSKNNCEDFAIYCKTGLLVADKAVIGRSGQAASVKGSMEAALAASVRGGLEVALNALVKGSLSAALTNIPLHLVTTTNLYGMAATSICTYYSSLYDADIGRRKDAIKVDVEDLPAMLGKGGTGCN